MKSEVKENRVDFSLIRYSQCWEDTEVLLESLNIQENDICFGILSAGDNVFSMLSENPKKVVALDISFPQIALAKIKMEVFNSLSYEEILEFMGVTKSTDPSWVMVFPLLKGLIVEKGSLLSHSAIISREMNIPAIVGVQGATTALKTGDFVQFDGSTGIIKKLDEI